MFIINILKLELNYRDFWVFVSFKYSSVKGDPSEIREERNTISLPIDAIPDGKLNILFRGRTVTDCLGVFL